VGLAPNGCCERPLISRGLLAEAGAAAQFNTDALYPLATSGARFVFFEPSCLSAMREDVPSLERRSAAPRRGSGGAIDAVRELLEQHLDENPASVSFAHARGQSSCMATAIRKPWASCP
jgi:Fe-S oxidoreductase